MFVRLKKVFGIALFFLRNVIMARRLNAIERQGRAGLIFRGYAKFDADSVSKIYSDLNDGAVFSIAQRALYAFIGNCCLFVVEQVDGRVVGMNMYYVNGRDVQDNLIHEGFIGVVPECNGMGIATTMRKMAIQHFKSAGLSGISTRISLNNAASLASAKKIGFLPQEEYRDAVTGERRYYMVHKF